MAKPYTQYHRQGASATTRPAGDDVRGNGCQTMSVTRETERESRWLTVGEVARHLRVSRDTVERWIHNGNLRAVNVGTRSTLVSRRCCWRVSMESLEAFLEGRASPLPPPRSPRVRLGSQTDVIEFIK